MKLVDLIAISWILFLVVMCGLILLAEEKPANASIPKKQNFSERWIDPQEKDCLVRTVFGEVRGQKEREVREVVGVILRRQLIGRWGNSICEVVKSPKQFSCWNKNDPNRKIMFRKGVKKTKSWKRIERIVMKAYNENYVSKSDHYWHKQAMKGQKNPSWAKACNGVQQIGKGSFCKIRKG